MTPARSNALHLPEEALAGYLLDGAGAADRALIEEHLAGCARCSRDHAELAEALGLLGASTDPVAPPARLRGAVLAAARSERQEAVVDAAGGLRRLPGRFGAPLRRRPWLRLAVPAVALAAALVVALIITSGGAAPPARELALGSGRLELAGSQATLAATAFAAQPADRTYQVWLIEPHRAPKSVGLFAGGERRVALSGEVGRGDVVAITVEPAGGSPAPTTKPIAVATI